MKRGVLEELMLVIATAATLLRKAWWQSLVAMVLFAILGFVPTTIGCIALCALSYFGGGSVALAFLAVGPMVAFGQAALGREVVLREVLEKSRERTLRLIAVYVRFFAVVMAFVWAVAVPLSFVRWRSDAFELFLIALAIVSIPVVLVAFARFSFLATAVVVLEELLPRSWWVSPHERISHLARGRLVVLSIATVAPIFVVIASIPELMPRFVDFGLTGIEWQPVRTAILIGSLFAAAYLHALLAVATWSVATGLGVEGEPASLDDEEPRDSS